MSSYKKRKLPKSQSQFRLAMKRFARNRGAVVCLILIILIILSAVFSDYLTPYGFEEQDIMARKLYPNLSHLFGTDNYGRDLLTRVLRGGRVSLLVAFMAVTISTVVAMTLGALAGYFGGWVDALIMRICDIFISIPGLILAMCMSAALGTGLFNTALAISVGGVWPMVRQLRASIMTLKDAEYLEASRAFGGSSFHIIIDHVVPHALTPMIVQVTMSIGGAITQIASLSFLGLGVQPPTPEWGNMLSEGKAFITSFWPMMFWPGLAIAVCLFAFSMIGDGLRDALDPRMKR